MYQVRVAVITFAVVSTFAALPAEAQGNQPGGGANNNLAARLEALEARVARLEGNITDADLVGTYRVTGFIGGTAADPNASVSIGAIFGTVTLNANHTATGEFGIIGNSLVQGTPWISSILSFPPEPSTATWSYADGVLHVTDGTENVDTFFNVGLGGRVLTFAGLGDDGEVNVIILTRLR